MMHAISRRPLLVACLVAAALLTPPSLLAQQPDYLIGPKDVLAISVWDQPDMTGKWTVEADGTFTFPLIGRVKAGGLTLRQLEADIVKRLVDGKYFRAPQVSVAVDQYVSQRVFITGEVRAPGTYTLTGDMTLIELLARAGSTTPSASGEALIVHMPAGKVATEAAKLDDSDGDTIHVDLKELQDSGLAKNVALHDGDTIIVPRAESVYVFGQVKNPGAYALQTRDTTVLQALALAGGITDRGAKNRITIDRVVKGRNVKIRVKALTELVRPGDTIIVPERYF